MLKKITVIGSVVAVAGLGVGGVASAWPGATTSQAAVAGTLPTPATPTASTAPATSTNKAAAGHGKKRATLAKRLARVSHAQWVSKDAKTGTFVTHNAVRGEITTAFAGSITIRATDGTSETFVVTGSTTVRVAGAAGTATMAQVKVGDRAVVLGTGSGPMTATRVLDRGAPGTKTAGTNSNGSTTGGSSHKGSTHKSGSVAPSGTSAPSTSVPTATTPTTPTSTTATAPTPTTATATATATPTS